MATVKIQYATAQTLTVTGLSTLANGSSANSAVVDNTASLYVDVAFEVLATTGSGAVATGTVDLFVKGSIDNVDFEDDANDRWIGSIALAAAGAASYKKVCFSAAAFGGALPPYFLLRVRNATGAALASGSAATLGVLLQSA